MVYPHLMLILAILASLLFASPTPDQCTEINTLLGGETLPWLGYEQGGWDLPSDMEIVERIDFKRGGLWMYEAESQPDVTWYWWFFSYDETTDANGNHSGAHDFCAVIVYA